MAFWKTKQFSELSKTWDKILYDNEFRDIEGEFSRGERQLTSSARKACRFENSDVIRAKEEFYRLVSGAVHKEKKMRHRDRLIMEYYSNGLKHNDIIKKLEGVGIACHRKMIYLTVSSYLHKWGIPILKKKN